MKNTLLIKLVELMNSRPCEFRELIGYGGRENIPKDLDEAQLFILAKMHLEFRCKYGNSGKVKDGDMYYCEYLNEFYDWLEAGFPGLDMSSINGYFKRNPL